VGLLKEVATIPIIPENIRIKNMNGTMVKYFLLVNVTAIIIISV
jgi:hypothetical protein